MAPRTTRTGASYSKSPIVKFHDEHKDTTQDDMDIFAAPISSDEEEDKLNVSSSLTSPAAKKVVTRSKFSPPRLPTSLTIKATKQESFSAVPDLDELFPPSQPKKKRKVDYAVRNIHTAVNEVEVQPEVTFMAPAALPLEEEPYNKTKFKIPQVVMESVRRSKRNTSKKTPFQIPSTRPLEELASTSPKFQMPTMLEDPDSSAPSVEDTIFDAPKLSQDFRRSRSGSTSSLSSRSSNDIDLSLVKQQELSHDDTDDCVVNPASSRCDLCHGQIEMSLYLEFTSKYKLPLKYSPKEKLCLAHHQWTARQMWTRKGYPVIDWQCLEADRIPNHIPQLSKILRRKASSFYRTKLDSVAQDPKTSRKALNDYLKDGVIHVAKQGYYGPRGARIMGHAITTTMEKELTARLKLDEIVRAAGVGGYVSAVLVPELMVELVKEDMHVETSDQARQILEQSTKDGAFLNSDDDEVVLRTDGDD